MSPEQIAALEDRVCLAYRKLHGSAAAHARAGEGRTPYRCPFGHGHWHCEALTFHEMADVARMIRDRRDPSASLLSSESQAG